MRLLDAVVHADPGRAVCRVRITPGASFVDRGRVPGPVCLEYMAQCAAVVRGCTANRRGAPVPGFLIGVRDLQLRVDHLMVGDELLVHAELVWGDATLGQFRCSVQRHGANVATAILNAFQPQRVLRPEDLP